MLYNQHLANTPSLSPPPPTQGDNTFILLDNNPAHLSSAGKHDHYGSSRTSALQTFLKYWNKMSVSPSTHKMCRNSRPQRTRQVSPLPAPPPRRHPPPQLILPPTAPLTPQLMLPPSFSSFLARKVPLSTFCMPRTFSVVEIPS